jgi:hypothetical protein
MDKCVACQIRNNNVYIPSNRTCHLYCPFQSKNVGSVCMACSKDLCQDGYMPRMEITNTDRYMKEYRVKNTTTFYQQNIDWYRIAKVSIDGLNMGTDYAVYSNRISSNHPLIRY